MKTKEMLLVICLLVGTVSKAQTFDWANAFGGTDPDYGSSIAVDDAGNVYTTGRFSGTVDFDPGAGTTVLAGGFFDIFIQKTDAAGNFLWARTVGGIGIDGGFSITVDDLGNVYTTGFFEGTVDFDPGAGTANLVSNGDVDVFVLKLDAAGNFLWAKNFGGASSDEGKSIAVDGSGNVYTTGNFASSVDFDPGVDTTSLSANGVNDIFIQKMDAGGNFLWAKVFGSVQDDQSSSIVIDDFGNIYATGFFRSTVDFDPGAGVTSFTSNGGFDCFVQKMDTTGNFLWAKTFGGSDSDNGASIAADGFGNVYISGVFVGTVDFDPGVGTTNLTSNGSVDCFVQKLDATGNFLWAKAFGGSDGESFCHLASDDFGNVYTTGAFLGTVDFDPGAGTNNLSSMGSNDVYVQKLDASGDFLWARTFGGPFWIFSNAITLSDVGDVYLTGNFGGTADFDPGVGTANLTSNGSFDIFVNKLTDCQVTTSIDVQTACTNYTWIDGNTYTSSNNSATYTLANAAGCDSVVTLDLTINTVNTATSTTDFTITADASGSTYQWIDCDNNNTPISGETAQAFTATANGNYAVIVTENGCSDTSACVAITAVGINETDFSAGMSLYPNPSTGMVNVRFTDLQESVSINITDVNGRRVSLKHYRDVSDVQIELGKASGLYYVTIQSKESTSIRKVLKK